MSMMDVVGVVGVMALEGVTRWSTQGSDDKICRGSSVIVSLLPSSRVNGLMNEAAESQVL